MKFNKYEKNGIVRIATEKAFKTLYEKEGYKLVKEKTNTKAEAVAETLKEKLNTVEDTEETTENDATTDGESEENTPEE